ncbi:16333_t:CDS:2, partial [Gigaspora rosea]
LFHYLLSSFDYNQQLCQLFHHHGHYQGSGNLGMIDTYNLDFNRLYTLEEFEFINDQFKARTLKIDGQPANLFDLDRNGKPIPMPQAPYYVEKGGFDFDVGGKTIREPVGKILSRSKFEEMDGKFKMCISQREPQCNGAAHRSRK